jgi:transposase
LSLSRVKGMSAEESGELYEHPADRLIARLQQEHIASLSRSIGKIERMVLARAKEMPWYQQLDTVPGVGRILGMTIAMEVGEIGRFGSAAQFASYCRAVKAQRMSNEKTKGKNNKKCGNRDLAWAFGEAANFAKRYDDRSRRWFDRKAERTNKVVATKALACKLAKAAWHVMSGNVPYDGDRVFGKAAANQGKGLATNQQN